MFWKTNLTDLASNENKITYFFLEKAVKNEDEHSLEGVEYCEQVCHDNRGLTNKKETEGPCEAQQAQQGESSHDPRPGKQKQKSKLKKRSNLT